MNVQSFYKPFTLILILTVFMCCNVVGQKIKAPNGYDKTLESFAFDGVSVDFVFNSDQPTFGDLFLIVGTEHPKFPPNSREFERLNEFGFEQTDDYFGILNDVDIANGVKIWLFPIVDGVEVYHNEGPYDAIRLTYEIARNSVETAELFKRTIDAFRNHLDVKTYYDGELLIKYNPVDQIINQTIDYCRNVLKVEPGSAEAMEIEW